MLQRTDPAKRCNDHRRIVACMLSEASRDRPVIVGWSTANRPLIPSPSMIIALPHHLGQQLPEKLHLSGVAAAFTHAIGTTQGRPAHDHRTISASSGQHTSHYLPVMIAPFPDHIDRDGVQKKMPAFAFPTKIGASRLNRKPAA
jgi:hypothetical protein